MKDRYYQALTDDPMVDVLVEQGSMREVQWLLTYEEWVDEIDTVEVAAHLSVMKFPAIESPLILAIVEATIAALEEEQ